MLRSAVVKEALIGVDVGGTKCAVVLGSRDGVVYAKKRFATETHHGADHAVRRIADAVEALAVAARDDGFSVIAAGISCGGPLDPERGIVLSPPNLPGWDEIPISRIIAERVRVPVTLRNDADAGALAEYRFGAGRGCRSLAFLTFGTGIGAGLILDGRLFTGGCGLAGEIGHIRIAPDGPSNYGKAGSFEGYCSGSGIAELGRRAGEAAEAAGKQVTWYANRHTEPITAAVLGDAAEAGEPIALEVYRESGTCLGRGCAILADILNLERIIIGSIYTRSRGIIEPSMRAEFEAEALPGAASCCAIVPAELGERIGDVASLCAAMEELDGET